MHIYVRVYIFTLLLTLPPSLTTYISVIPTLGNIDNDEITKFIYAVFTKLSNFFFQSNKLSYPSSEPTLHHHIFFL